MIQVKLISYSQLPRETDASGHKCISDVTTLDLIAYCARVSNPANQLNTETNDRLIDYLIRHKHWSPFEMVSACLEITTSRDIARQMLRHRSFSFQEYSQRYANVDQLGEYFAYREARLQDTENRQNSIELTEEQIDLQYEWNSYQSKVIDAAKEAYEWAIDNGIAKEQARAVLPEGLTKSVILMNGTIRSWIHYLELRREEGTQKEHREVAEQIAKVISSIFPKLETLNK